MNDVERVYIEAVGRDDDALLIGFRWLVDRARTAARAGVVAMHALANVKRLPPVLSTAAATRFARDKRLSIEGIMVELMTERHEPTGYPLGPTLVVWANDERLERVEELRPAAVCAIPWMQGGIDDWKANYSPTELRSGRRAESATIDNAVVAAALADLTATVNLGTGLGHPSDRAAAVSLFRILKAGGERYDPGAVRAFAVNNGWSQPDARELEEIARGVLDGKRFRVERFGWADDILEQWRAAAVR